MLNKLCFYIAFIKYTVFNSKTKGLKFHFWMSEGKTLYQSEDIDPRIGMGVAWTKNIQNNIFMTFCLTFFKTFCLKLYVFGV